MIALLVRTGYICDEFSYEFFIVMRNAGKQAQTNIKADEVRRFASSGFIRERKQLRRRPLTTTSRKQ